MNVKKKRGGDGVEISEEECKGTAGKMRESGGEGAWEEGLGRGPGRRWREEPLPGEQNEAQVGTGAASGG